VSSNKGFLFDLDGVLVDTAVFHYKAWKRMTLSLGFEIDEVFNEQLKGISRMDSLEIILKYGKIELTEAEKIKWATQKNTWYLDMVHQMTEDNILPGVMSFLNESKKLGLKIALGSASKNAPIILEKVGIAPFFDAIIDGNQVSQSKPDPEVFIKGADALSLDYANCIVFEDAEAGIAAAHAAGMKAVGIGKKEDLPKSNFLCKGLFEISPQQILEIL
jgi:beta-phosphoglucomutase